MVTRICYGSASASSRLDGSNQAPVSPCAKKLAATNTLLVACALLIQVSSCKDQKQDEPSPSVEVDIGTKVEPDPFANCETYTSCRLECPPGTKEKCMDTSERCFCERPDGTRHGPYKHWDSEGFCERAYDEDELDGLHVCWWENGVKRKEITYRRGIVEGRLRHWHPNGQPSVDRMYRGGKIHGYNRSWYADGQQRRDAQYLHGMPCGEMRCWTEDGDLVPCEGENRCRDSEERTHCPPCVECPEGSELTRTRKMRGRHCTRPDGTKHGYYWVWHRSRGPQKISAEYREDRLHGELREWHENGKPFRVGEYREGRACGGWHCWDAEENVAPCEELKGCVPRKDGAYCPPCE